MGLWKKLRRVPEFDVQLFDLFNEYQDRAAGCSDLFAPIARQAFTPPAESVEFLFVES